MIRMMRHIELINHFICGTKFKENNPRFLFGEIGERLPNGRWSSVDFTHQEVRDLCVQFFKEVCENYDVDGVELDFLRHFELFKNVGWGGVASQEQLDMLTDMVSQIRKSHRRSRNEERQSNIGSNKGSYFS